MGMDERESQEFTLEDIIKEFGGHTDEPSPEPIPEQIQEPELTPQVTQEVTEPVISQEAAVEEEIQEEEILDVNAIIAEVSAAEAKPLTEDALVMEPVTEDTIIMEPVSEPVAEDVLERHTQVVDTEAIRQELAAEPAAMQGDTIRMDEGDLETILSETAQDEDVKEYEPAQPQEEFTEEWEPEYEQPMGDYIPPQPIIFQPQSRLRELKRKLVTGPEKRYYEISEVGLGKLQLAIFLCAVVVLLGVLTSVLYATGHVPEGRMRLMVFGQLFLMLLAALPGSFQLIEGVEDMCHGRFSLNSLLTCTFAACIMDAVFCLQSLRVPCCAAFSLTMLMSLWSAYHKRSTEMGMMDTMRKATQLDKLSVAEDYMDGQKGLLREQAQVEDFMDNYRSASAPEKVLNKYSLAALLVSLALGVLGGILKGPSTGVQVLSVSLLAGVPASAFISHTRPWSILERQLHKVGAVLCGWKGVMGLKGKVVFPVAHTDLFPAGSAKMNGVKFFGSREPDEIVAYCTALVEADGGTLAPLFRQVLESRNARHYDVENFRAYPGGIGGEVMGEPVLVGMFPFLQDMGVEIPEGIRVNQAVCVSIDGELCGLFAVTYEKDRNAALGLHVLCSNRKVKTVLTSNDFMLTDSFLRAKFGINPKRIQMPDHELCRQLQEKKLPEDAQALVMSTRSGATPFVVGVMGAKALRTASILGTVIHMLGGILGLGAMAVLTILGRTDLLTPMNMFLYQLVWLVPGLLVTYWTKII